MWINRQWYSTSIFRRFHFFPSFQSIYQSERKTTNEKKHKEKEKQIRIVLGSKFNSCHFIRKLNILTHFYQIVIKPPARNLCASISFFSSLPCLLSFALEIVPFVCVCMPLGWLIPKRVCTYCCGSGLLCGLRDISSFRWFKGEIKAIHRIFFQLALIASDSVVWPFPPAMLCARTSK